MRIAACIKRVPITGGRILLTDDARAINTQHLGFTISPHEECGVEEAVRLIEANKGDSVVLTLGPSEAVEQLGDAMALGIDRAIHLQTEGQEWDAEATAGALLEAIRADESAHGPFDIIFFGYESADSGGFQVGIRVAYGLGRPCVTGLKKVTLEGSQVRCEQQVEGGRDVYVVPLPAVLTVKEGLNLPRYPSVPGKMRARSKPVAVVTPSRPAPRLELVKLAVPAGQGRRSGRGDAPQVGRQPSRGGAAAQRTAPDHRRAAHGCGGRWARSARGRPASSARPRHDGSGVGPRRAEQRRRVAGGCQGHRERWPRRRFERRFRDHRGA